MGWGVWPTHQPNWRPPHSGAVWRQRGSPGSDLKIPSGGSQETIPRVGKTKNVTRGAAPDPYMHTFPVLPFSEGSGAQSSKAP